jgi:hypothetical protein
LAAVIAKSRDLGYIGISLKWKLNTGKTTAGGAHLTAIETDAKVNGP